MRISDWSSDVCSSDLSKQAGVHQTRAVFVAQRTDQQTAEDRHGDRSDRDIGELLLAQPEFALDHRHQRGDGKPCKKADEEREPAEMKCAQQRRAQTDRKSVVEGTRLSVRVGHGGRRIIKNRKKNKK